VLVQALTHGNEICGAIALDWLLRQAWRPKREKISRAHWASVIVADGAHTRMRCRAGFTRVMASSGPSTRIQST
jgi:hypothetical protein